MYRNREYVKSLWENVEGPLNVYINIPFCYCRCRYCLYKGKVTSFSERERYIKEYLIPELYEFQETLNRKDIECVYIGGGTPNSVELETLAPVFEMEFFKKAPVKIIENNPAFTDASYLDEVAKAGFTLVTFGIQSFDAESLAYQNRPCVSSERIKSYIEICRKNRVYTSIDLMCYLKSYTVKDLSIFNEDFEKAVVAGPDFITVYPELNLIMKDGRAADAFTEKIKNVNSFPYRGITPEQNNPRRIFRFLNEGISRKTFYEKILPYYENDFPYAIQNIIGFGDFNSGQEIVSYVPRRFFYTEHYNSGNTMYNVKFDGTEKKG